MGVRRLFFQGRAKIFRGGKNLLFAYKITEKILFFSKSLKTCNFLPALAPLPPLDAHPYSRWATLFSKLFNSRSLKDIACIQ